ncbi:MAG TPA: glutamate--tRNA ligase [Acidimicrobiales bacterium]|nr:glutamate--tRNA ligase [Acidimicrobiales bacterium]
MSTPLPRVRFSPAPTGFLHLGSARSALFNWLFARHTGGEMLLRVEDTDLERNRPELIDTILDSLRWLGIDWDGEPVHQSDRVDLHRDAVARLLASGNAYRCGCSQDEVKARAEARGGPPGYDGHCRDRDIAPGSGVVVRFRTPDDGTTAFDDVIRGVVAFENTNLEDFVVQRSDGSPMFLVANAVDDVDMGITHVIRGEDLVNVTPKVLLLREALGVTERPVFAHLPLVLNEKRQKLSKRRDDVAVADYRARGFLPSAMANYLALLGWGPPDGVEVRPVEEIVGLFRLEDVNKAGAVFDLQKLTHVNARHIEALTTEAFVTAARPFLLDQPWGAAVEADPAPFEALAPVVQERTHTLLDVADMVDFVYLDEPTVDEAAWEKAMVKGAAAAEILDGIIDAYEAVDEDGWVHENGEREPLKEALLAVGEAHGLKLGKAQAPVRVAVTGRSVGPPLFESLVVLGRARTLERLRRARARL